MFLEMKMKWIENFLKTAFISLVKEFTRAEGAEH